MTDREFPGNRLDHRFGGGPLAPHDRTTGEDWQT
jgi:hypothetical protein